MKRLFKFLSMVLLLLVICCGGYFAYGFVDAITAADDLKTKADSIIATGLGGSSLGEERYRQLLMVQDPQFEHHNGVDITTPGAGVTTISQSLAKRLGFEKFTPGIGKIKQTGYALGLESQLSKEQIMALWLDTVEMGQGPNGWVTGFHRMSEASYSASPSVIREDQFFTLLAVLIAPGRYKIGSEDESLSNRVERIRRLVYGACVPIDNSDVWLEGCR